jgi:hypothetical protein
VPTVPLYCRIYCRAASRHGAPTVHRWHRFHGVPAVLLYCRAASCHTRITDCTLSSLCTASCVAFCILQGSITSWRANCASFASLGALAKLQQLSLHAFHCPGVLYDGVLIVCFWLLPHLLQGSITSWRANCASFASLGALARLQQLSLHAFHCPGVLHDGVLIVCFSLLPHLLQGSITS